MQASLIIPTFNREELLVQTLRCALQQDLEDYEILVIDQTPVHQPETEQFLHANADRIRYIRQSPPSVTQARNTGLRQAHGEVLVFVDDDTSFEPDFLAAHVAAHAAGADIVQGRVLERDSKPVHHPTWLTSTLRFTGGDNYDRDGITNNITGCNCSISRTVVSAIGYFDERFYGISVREESDYALRAWKAGLRLVFSAKAGLFHHKSPAGGVSSGIRNLFFDESYYFCEFLFSKKHFPRWVQWLYRIRLRRRGRKMLRRLMQAAEARAQEALRQPAKKS